MIFLSLTIPIVNYQIDEYLRPNGPLFHRWLPKGREDALDISVMDERNYLKLWFERRGYVRNNSFIVYDKNREEVDEETMQRQASLDAGYLFGEARFAHISRYELVAIRNNNINSEDYITLGKRLIEFLYEPIADFIDLLRLQYGQYWLMRLEKWDSRKESLGIYCTHNLGLKWRENESDYWRDFQPNDLRRIFTPERLPGRGYAEYLTENDWRRLQRDFNLCRKKTLTLSVLGRAHELCDNGHIQEAFVQGVTALELAIHDFMRCKVPSDSVEQFSKLPLHTQSFVLGTSIGISSVELNNTKKAIELRNKIVHEGQEAKDERRELFLSLLKVSSQFLGLKEFKIPVLVSSNQLSPQLSGGSEAIIFSKFSITSQSRQRSDGSA